MHDLRFAFIFFARRNVINEELRVREREYSERKYDRLHFNDQRLMSFWGEYYEEWVSEEK